MDTALLSAAITSLPKHLLVNREPFWSQVAPAVYLHRIDRSEIPAFTAGFSRGFVERVRCTWQRWWESADEVLAIHPVKWVKCYKKGPWIGLTERTWPKITFDRFGSAEPIEAGVT